MKTMDDVRKGYAGRTVFVTGADGFIGSHLVESLVEMNADVHAFVRATSSGGIRNISHLRNRIHLYRGNLEDYHNVRSTLKALRPCRDLIIFHLAAQAHVGESWHRPFETVRSNVVATLNLLEACVELDLHLWKFDTAGTSEEYGETQPGGTVSGSPALTERSLTNPKSVYATSKLAADFLTMNYCDAYGLPGVTTRMFNNYGPRQDPRYVTGTIVSQALCRDVVALGNLSPRRDFCYVEDGVAGHLHTALWGNPGEVYAYGFGRNLSIGEWAQLILDVGRREGYWAGREIISTPGRLRPGRSDVGELLVGFAKLHEKTGWSPQITWEEGIRRTIRWYAEHQDVWRGRVDW